MASEQDDRRGRRRRRVAVVGATGLLLVVALVIGGQLDRAPTEGRYRPAVAPSGLSGECSPLPAEVDLDLPLQVRADRPLAQPSGTLVRRLDLHYDLVDATVAEGRVTDALTAAGFTEVPAEAGADPEIDRWFALVGYGLVGVAVQPFDVDGDSIVRGALTLDVPSDTLTTAVEQTCDDPQQTKRYPEYAEGGS